MQMVNSYGQNQNHYLTKNGIILLLSLFAQEINPFPGNCASMLCSLPVDLAASNWKFC
jgi:hypothetical protein